MKVLVVDDNIAIQEILKEIISDAGHEAYLASSIVDAAEFILEIHPDLIFLDSYVGGENGLKMIDIVHEEDSEMNMKIYVIKNNREHIPKDEPFVLGEIEKPFTSADIIEILENISNVLDSTTPVKKQITPKRRFSLRKKRNKEQVEPEKPKLPSGKTHIIIEDTPSIVYNYAEKFSNEGYTILIVTTNKIKAIKERMKYGKMNIIALSSKPRLDYKDIRKLGTLTKTINNFIKDNDRPVVVIDRLLALLDKNGANRILTMIRQLTTENEGTATFLISTDERSIDKKGMDILGHNVEIHMIESIEVIK
ncbi:MAG TPA: response regulator [Candidatus Methanomethylophilaceae archaeon]|nr:response regulator [Candidatus Methanomethylophilaceae archaeon]